MRKHVKARIERNRALGQQDAAHRCQFCRSVLVGGGLEAFGKAGRFCDEECFAGHQLAEDLIAAARAAERVKGQA